MADLSPPYGWDLADDGWVVDPMFYKKTRPWVGRVLFFLTGVVLRLPGDQAHAFELEQNLVGAVVDVHIFGFHAQFWVCWYVIGV